jgi:hypothetical protein
VLDPARLHAFDPHSEQALTGAAALRTPSASSLRRRERDQQVDRGSSAVSADYHE